jgi:hypothetical protein
LWGLVASLEISRAFDSQRMGFAKATSGFFTLTLEKFLLDQFSTGPNTICPADLLTVWHRILA